MFEGHMQLVPLLSTSLLSKDNLNESTDNLLSIVGLYIMLYIILNDMLYEQNCPVKVCSLSFGFGSISLSLLSLSLSLSLSLVSIRRSLT